MIAVQEIVDKISSQLDAEGSDRYRFEQDYKPAIVYAVDWLVAVFNSAFSSKKLTEENLRDLVKTVVFQTSGFSRFDLSLLSPDQVWSILRINPEPEIYPSGSTITLTQDESKSFLHPNIKYLGSSYSAKRLSLEEWEESRENIFEAGNSVMKGSFSSYAYLNDTTYSPSAFPEIEIRPKIPKQFIGFTYLKYPTPINSIGDYIEFPRSLTNLVVSKAENFISVKQGDQTNLFSVSLREVNELVQLMI